MLRAQSQFEQVMNTVCQVRSLGKLPGDQELMYLHGPGQELGILLQSLAMAGGT